jgi:hypothetical protein
VTDEAETKQLLAEIREAVMSYGKPKARKKAPADDQKPSDESER